MMNRDQVQTLLDQMLAVGTPKPEIIRQIAVDCLGWPYVFGAWGEDCTPANRKRRARSDHPTIVSACPALNGKTCEACQWGIGVRMFDCRGFTAWLIRQVGLDITGQGATSQYNTNANWIRKGKISEMPDCVCCVFKQTSAGKMEHTGMHIGGGQIIHCSKNVQTGNTSDRGWTHYAIPVGLYSEEEIPVQIVKPILRKGSKGDNVRELQRDLNGLGYDCGTADGVFGEKTKSAVEKFQSDHGLKADGIVGPLTWAAIDEALAEMPNEPVDETRYTVTCYGMTRDQVRQIREICPTADVTKEGE